MSSPAYIIGNGGHAHVIASLLPEAGTRFVVLENAAPEQVLYTEFLSGICGPGVAIYLGIGNNTAREKVFNEIHAAGGALSNCIAPNAFVARDAIIGEGVFIGMGAIVGARAYLGVNCIINTLSSLDHDCVLGDHGQMTGAVTFGGTVKVGPRSFLGLKSCVVPKITIGAGVTVLAGSMVTRDLPDGVTAGGYPARVVRS